MRGLLIASALLGACKSDGQKAYERLASELNPVVVEMRPYAARILAMPRTLILGYDACSGDTRTEACLKEPSAALDGYASRYGEHCAEGDATCVRHACRTFEQNKCVDEVCASGDAELAQLSSIDHEGCMAADAVLERLQSIRYFDDQVGYLVHAPHEAAGTMGPDVIARMAIDLSQSACTDDGQPPHTDELRCSRIHRCSWHCLDVWIAIAWDIQYLHDSAAEHDVNIELLVPTPPKRYK